MMYLKGRPNSYNTHMHSFHAEQCREVTELSKYVLDLKSENLEYDTKWKLIHKAAPNSCMSNMAAIINSHITEVLKPDSDPNIRICSCR